MLGLKAKELPAIIDAWKANKLDHYMAIRAVGKRALREDHLHWLTSPESLRQQQEWSLKRRVAEFNLRFAPAKITLYRLRKLYQERRIKQRILRIDI